MNLSDGEKLIIFMLAEMYEKLDVNGETEPDFLRSAIVNDHLWAIRWKYSGIPFEPAEDPPLVKEVVDILEMWSYIEYTYSKLDEKQRQELAQEAAPLGENPRFRGFDGNYESDHMSVAMFMVNQLDRFQEFRGRNFNCHHPSLENHKRMLAVFEPLRASLADLSPSAKVLAKILKG